MRTERRRFAAVAALPEDDLHQEAVKGLLRAAAKFDPSFGVPFAKYLPWWVRREVRLAAVKNHRIHVPHRHHFRGLGGLDPEVAEAVRRSRRVGQVAPWMGRAGGGGGVAADDADLVSRLLACLTEQEGKAVRLRFFAGLKAAEVADRLGVTEDRVFKLLRRALERMRRLARDPRVLGE